MALFFGGTGAAGVPTLAKGLQSELKRLNLTNVSINSVLALPYFGFSFTEEQKNNIGLFADSASFLDNTRAALDYYYHTEVNDLFDSTYCIGLDHYARMPTAKEGGADQLNPACLVELLGATAIHDIASNEGKSNGLVMLSAYRGGQDIDAPDIPVLSQGDNNLKMTRCTALSLALKAIVFPIIDADNEQSAQYPWVRDLLPSKEDSWSNIVGDMLPLKNLANSYLRWFSEIGRTTPNLKNVLGGLFRDDSITDMKRLIELLRNYEKGDDNKALYHLIEEYSAASMHPTNRGNGGGSRHYARHDERY